MLFFRFEVIYDNMNETTSQSHFGNSLCWISQYHRRILRIQSYETEIYDTRQSVSFWVGHQNTETGTSQSESKKPHSTFEIH